MRKRLDTPDDVKDEIDRLVEEMKAKNWNYTQQFIGRTTQEIADIAPECGCFLGFRAKEDAYFPECTWSLSIFHYLYEGRAKSILSEIFKTPSERIFHDAVTKYFGETYDNDLAQRMEGLSRK